MPRVPTLEPRVEAAPLQPAFQRSMDVSSGTRAIGNALVEAGDVIDRIALRDDQAKAYDADNAIMDAWGEWQRENASKYRGSRAAEYLPAAKQWWDEAKAKYTGDLSNRSKELIGRTLGAKRTAALNSVGAVAEREQELHVTASEEGTIKNSLRTAIDTMQPGVGVAAVTDVIKGRAARNKWSPEETEAKLHEALAPMHQAYIAKLAVNDPAAAKAYYDANQSTLPIGVRPQIEQVLQNEADNAKAREFAASVASQPLDKQMEAAAKLEPKVREKALIEVRNNFAMVREAQRVKEENAADTAWQMVGRGVKPSEAVLGMMDGHQRVQLQDYLLQKAKHAADSAAAGVKEKPIKTDVATHALLWDMANNDPDTFMDPKTRIAAYRYKLSDADFEQLMTMQRTMRAAKGKPDAKQPEVMTLHQQVSGAMAAAGIDPKKDPEGAYAAQREIQRRLDVVAAGKKDNVLTPQERTAVIDEVLIDKVYMPGAVFGRNEVQIASLTEEQRRKASVDVTVNDPRYGALKKTIPIGSIPKNEYLQAVEALRARGMPATAAAVAQLWHDTKNPAKR